MQWFTDHQALLLPALGAAVVGVLDLIFAVNPKARANGLAHWLYLAAGGKDTPAS